MSRPKVFPEVRGSHLAGKLERKRALKALAKSKSKKGEMANSKVTPINSRKQVEQDDKPKRRRGRPLPTVDRDVIVGAIGRYGKEHVVDLLQTIDTKNPSPFSTIADLQSDPEHRWLRRNYQALTDLSEYIQNNCQEQLRFPKQVIPSGPLAHAPTVPERALAERPTSDHAFITKLVADVVTQSVTQAMAAAFSVLQTSAPAHPTLPPRSEPFRALRSESEAAPDSAEQGPPVSEPVPFKDRPDWIKRKCLHDIHTRIAARIREQGFEISRPHAEAWTRSYVEFAKETGVNVRAMASERSDRSGVVVHPVEIIEELGELDRFYATVQRVWEGWF